jgi:hypothetical protein
MPNPQQIPQRQLDTGPAGWFRPEAMVPAANQIRVRAGYVFTGAEGVRVPNPALSGLPQDQLTAGFAVVAPGTQRYDLVYLTATGVATILQGTAVPTGTAFPQGGPGWEGTNPGPKVPDTAFPVAWVFVNETGSVSIASSDITQIDGFVRTTRDLDGYLVDKGLLGAAPTGANDIVTTMFAGETPGGSDTVRGIVTSPPGNYVGLLDQNGDELLHATTPGSRIYGRITEAATVWTLSYFYLSAVGAETAVVAIETETEGGAPTNLRLVATPKVFSRNDPARPLFDSTAYRLSDQVVGDIPMATTTVPGKVELATNGEAIAGVVVQGNDDRLDGVFARLNSGGAVSGRRSRLNLIEGTGMSIAIVDDPGSDEIDVTLTVTSPGTYRARSNGATVSGTGNLSLAPVDGIAYTPRLALNIGQFGATPQIVGAAVSASVEACAVIQGVNFACSINFTNFIDSTVVGGGDTLNITTFDITDVFATRTLGTASYSSVWFITGDA